MHHSILQKSINKYYQTDKNVSTFSVTLLFYIQLVLVSFLFLTAILILVFTPYGNVPFYISITVGSLLFMGTALVFNLKGQYKLSLKIMLVLLYAVPWAAILYEFFSHSGDFMPSIFVVAPIQISALFFSRKPMFALVAVQTVAITILIVISPNKSNYNWLTLVSYVFLTSALGAITSYVLRTQYETLATSRKNLADSEQALRDLSVTDPLTGLHNRRYMEQQFEVVENQTSEAYGLLMIDVDHFKSINDTYGHAVGDKTIQGVANILSHAIREKDVAYRFGGDEFVVMLFVETLQETLEIAERIKARVEELATDIDGNTLKLITTSIGVAHKPDHGTDPNSVLKAADIALYQAKQCGRNRIIVANLSCPVPPGVHTGI